MATIQECFTGRVAQREYAQEFDFIVTDTGSSFLREFVTAKVVEQTFVFLGLTCAQAFSTLGITVTDNGGTSYTFTPKSSITDGSTGTRVMIVEVVDVQRIPMSPHMWELVVTRRGYRYYVNGSHIPLSGEPAWMAAYV